MTPRDTPDPLPGISLDIRSAFLRGLPLEFESIEPTRVVGSMQLGPDQHTPWGVVHGGAYTTAIESVASVGASTAVLDRGQFAVGVNNNTDFLRPLVTGKVLVVAEPVQQGCNTAALASRHHPCR